MEYQRDAHRVHLIVYYLLWCPKRCKAVLGGPIAEDCCLLIAQQCAERGWHILELAMQPDHIHLCVRVWPVDAAEVVKQCKGLTAHHLRQKYAVLRRMPSLRTRSYFASAAGNVSAEIITRYSAAQKGV